MKIMISKEIMNNNIMKIDEQMKKIENIMIQFQTLKYSVKQMTRKM